MNKQTKYLSTIGRIATPAAMVVFMAHEITTSMSVVGWWGVSVLFGAILTAVGVEVVGMLSGMTLEGFWRQGNLSRSILSFVLLLIYTSAAVYILRNNPTILPVPIVAAVVYIVSALADSLISQEEKQTIEQQRDMDWERTQIEKDRELERQLKIADKKLKHEEKMARIQVKASATRSNSQPSRKKTSTEPAKHYECVCGRVFEGSRSYNAHRRHCEIPASEPAKIYENGQDR